jgi:hypothetical protein
MLRRNTRRSRDGYAQSVRKSFAQSLRYDPNHKGLACACRAGYENGFSAVHGGKGNALRRQQLTLVGIDVGTAGFRVRRVWGSA